MGISLDADSIRDEVHDGGIEYHDLTSAQVAAILALSDEDLNIAIDAAADDHFWAAYDSTRRSAIAALAKAVTERKGTFEYVVHVEAPTREQADQVMAERLTPDEDYGFPYTIGYDYETHEEDS